MPTDPKQLFLDSILKRFDTLRRDDQVADTLPAWQQQKQLLRHRLAATWGGFPETPAPLEPRVLGVLNRDGYRIERIVLQTRPGIEMTANAYVPTGAGKSPGVLCVHGHWRGAKQDPVPQARCIGLAKLGFFVLAVDAFGAGERGVGKALGEYHGEMTGATLLPIGLPLPGLQVYDNMRAADYLQSRPEVDGTKLGITGASGGGNQTMYAGAFDERFTCVVPTCSVGTYRSYLGAACCVCELLPGAMSYTEEWAILGMVAPRALLVINATRDAFQFSVGEAQKSIAKTQQIFRLHDQAGKVAHAIFESGHDYGKAMREAMYGWMTLHLKGEGQGNPIPEPALQTEDPEGLRCWPGESRPESFVTLPQFAAREAEKILTKHRESWPTHLPMWQTYALQTRHALLSGVLGISDTVANSGLRVPGNVKKKASQVADNGQTVDIWDTEAGLEITLTTRAGKKGCPVVVVLSMGGASQAIMHPLTKKREQNGDTVVCVDLRATGVYAIPGDVIGKAPDHNSAEWSIWCGRPLLGQWIVDALCAVTATASENGGYGAITLVGLGPAALIAIGAAVFEPRIERVIAVDALASFKSSTPYVGQWMGLMAPGILRDAGDIPHLAALLAPRSLQILSAVNGAGQSLTENEMRAAFEPTAAIYRLHNAMNKLVVKSDATAAD